MAFKIFRRLADLLDLDETNKTAGYSVVVNATADGYELSNVSGGGGGGGAPTDATYITQTSNASLSAEQALGDLATGVLKNTTTTGVLSIATEGTDYYGPGGTDVAVADGGTGASTAAGARTNLGLGSIATQDSSAVTITGGSVAGITDIAVADGGTGASTAAGARTNLGAAPLDATYITQTANGELSGEQALSTLATGMVKVTNGTGALSTGTEGTDYYKPGGTDVAVADGGTGGSDAATARSNLAAAPSAAKYIVQTADSELSAEQALGSLATGIVKNTTTTGVLSIATAGTDYYNPGGTDVALADGGTGSSLSDPNADRIMFWDDSAGSVDWLTAGTGLTISGTTISASGSGGTRHAAIDLTNPQISANTGNSFFTVVGLTDWDAGHWEFGKDVDGKIYGIVKVPPDYTSGGVIKMSIAANATSGVTRLVVATKAVADGESMNPTLTDETAQDITVPGTAYLRKVVSFTLTETLAASDLLLVEIYHAGAHANDTLAVNTLLFGAWLEYTA